MALGHIAVKQGDIAAAESYYAQALLLARTSASTSATAAATGGLAVVALWTGSQERAARLSRQSIALWRQDGDASGLASALNVAGLVEIQRGRHRDAGVLLEEGLMVSQAAGDEGLTAAHLNKLGWCRLEDARLDAAARYFGGSATRIVSTPAGVNPGSPLRRPANPRASISARLMLSARSRSSGERY